MTNIIQPTAQLLDLIDQMPNREYPLGEFDSTLFRDELLRINHGVFPVDTIAHSSKIMAKIIPSNSGNVLDIGTGTGIQSIVAWYKGAKSITAVDIDQSAVENAAYNFTRFSMSHVVCFQSDLFANISGKRYDTIIAQLPFSDVDTSVRYGGMLFDNNFEIHDQFLRTCKDYLAPGGKVYLSGGSLANRGKLDELLENNNLCIVQTLSEDFNNQRWDAYEIMRC